nr:TPA_asm: N [Fagopyrum alphacytorhabdovirus 1]
MDPEKKKKLQMLRAREMERSHQPPKQATAQTSKPADQGKQKKYGDLDAIDMTLAQRLSTWADSSFKQIRIYQVEQLTTDEAVLFGQSMVKAIQEDTVTADTVMMILYLAISLRSTGDPGEYLLTDISDIMENMIETQKPAPDTTSDETDADQASRAEQLALLIARKKKGKTAAATSVEANVGALRGTARDIEISDDKDSIAAAYAYMAAFLMRLQCREPSKVASTFETAKNRFPGFYDAGHEVLSNVELSEEPLIAIRNILARKPEMVSTWVAWAAYSENEASLIKQDLGLLQYLVLQVFAYQGMHVVTQVLAIHQITKVPMGFLLSELDCRITRSAVTEVYNILKSYHRNSLHPNRKTYFRYARVWDDAYFSRVQSKNCPQLLYLTARTVKELSPNSLSDPTQIFAVKNMSDTLKATLDEVSEKLIALIYASAGDDDEAGSIWAELGQKRIPAV